MHYLVGDIQGCCDAFERMLAEIGFSPSRDHVHVLGDLVNRGPDSAGVLRRLSGLGQSATCLLGNHDMHLLAMAAGIRKPHKGDTAGAMLSDPELPALLDWLRQQRLADQAHGWLLVHAGVVPQWDAAQVLRLAGEVEALISGPGLAEFLPQMYGNQPALWDEKLQGPERWRFVINALTRLRFCDTAGRMDFDAKEGANLAPSGLLPWFEVPGRQTATTPIAFGHWSTLGLRNEPLLLSLDTGCVWGGALTAARIDGGRREIVQVQCAQALAPF